MHDHRLDRGTTAIGIFFVLIGLIAFVWIANGADAAAFAAAAPYLMPLLLVGLGVVVLATAVPSHAASSGDRPARATPDSSRPDERIDVGLDGAERAQIDISFGAGHLRVGRAGPGHLVDGTIVGGDVVHDQVGRVRLQSDTPWLEWVPGLQRDWTIGVTGELPVRLDVRTGAADVDLDCRELQLDELVVHAGASAVRVHAAAHGFSRIRTETGVGSLDVAIPGGVAARVRTSAVLGSREIDLARFPAVPGGYETPGFDGAPDRVEVDARTALGSLRIR
jgi:hypothetical protein